MTTSLGTVFSTDEKIVAQADLKMIGSTVKSLIVEFDHEKLEQLLSSGSIIPKSMRNTAKYEVRLVL